MPSSLIGRSQGTFYCSILIICGAEAVGKGETVAVDLLKDFWAARLFTSSHSFFTSIQFYAAGVFLVTVLFDFQRPPPIFLLLRSITVVLSRWTLVIWRELKCETCRRSPKCYVTFLFFWGFFLIFAPTVGKVSKVKSFKMQFDAAELFCFSSCCVCLLLSTVCFPLATKGLFWFQTYPLNLFHRFYCLHEHLTLPSSEFFIDMMLLVILCCKPIAVVPHLKKIKK